MHVEQTRDGKPAGCIDYPGAVRCLAPFDRNDDAVLDKDILPRPHHALDHIDHVNIANQQTRGVFPGLRQGQRPHHANRKSCRGNREQHRKPAQYPDYPTSHDCNCTEIAAGSDPQPAAALT
jgi:hypothetical protein